MHTGYTYLHLSSFWQVHPQTPSPGPFVCKSPILFFPSSQSTSQSVSCCPWTGVDPDLWFLSAQAGGLLGEPLHLYLSGTPGEAAWRSIPSVPGASTFTKQSITWVLGWHSSAHRESPKAVAVGSGGLGGQRRCPRVSATRSCDFLVLQRCAQGWHHRPHQPPLDNVVRHAAQLTYSCGVWYLVSTSVQQQIWSCCSNGE